MIVPVIQDRLTVSAENYLRLNEAIEAAFRFGSGKFKSCTKVPAIPSPQAGIAALRYCHPGSDAGTFLLSITRWEPVRTAAASGERSASIGAALPDRSLSIASGVVKPFQSGHSKECQRDLMRAAARNEIDVNCPFEELPQSDQNWVIEGDGGNPEEAWEQGQWCGVKGFSIGSSRRPTKCTSGFF